MFELTVVIIAIGLLTLLAIWIRPATVSNNVRLKWV